MRLIDADAAKRRVADTYFDTLIPAVNRAFDDSPTVDAVPVVRCKDCKYIVEATVNSNGFLICHINDMEISQTDFCSHGERKEAGNA